MSHELPVIRTSEEMAASLDTYPVKAALADLGGGLLRFAHVTFSAVGTDEIYAKVEERDAAGKGPHFDIYDPYLHDEIAFVGVYNLSGHNKVTTVDLPHELNIIYTDMFEGSDETAYQARRLMASLALLNPAAEPKTGRLDPGMGLLLPQEEAGPRVVHEIVPVDETDPGKYVKLLVPAQDEASREIITNSSYVTLDELVTKGLHNQFVIRNAQSGEPEEAGTDVHDESHEEESHQRPQMVRVRGRQRRRQVRLD